MPSVVQLSHDTVNGGKAESQQDHPEGLRRPRQNRIQGQQGRQGRAGVYLLGPVLSLGEVLVQVGSSALGSAHPLLSLLASLLHSAAHSSC